MGTHNPRLVPVVGLSMVVALIVFVIVFVLASATVGVPSEVSVPLLVLAALHSFKNRDGRVAG